MIDTLIMERKELEKRRERELSKDAPHFWRLHYSPSLSLSRKKYHGV